LYLRVLSAELIGNTFSPEAYEPLRKILEDPEENEVLKLAAARSLTQVTSMNPELTGGHSNYVSHEVFEGAVNYVKGALDRVSVK
jgi:HEAT repeat protein